MPYVDQRRRAELSEVLNVVDAIGAENLEVGDINYIVTSILHKWLRKTGIRYKHINSMIGVLECAKLELYRQIASRYEDEKKIENGPVSVLDQDYPDNL